MLALSKTHITSSAALLSLAIWSAQSLAQDEDIFDLGFEDLMNVDVTLATRTEESLRSVPSSMTVFTRQQIRYLGVSNVKDLLNYVPGLQVTRGDWVGAVPKEHARGVYLDNGYLLFMINGERINEVSFGKASVYTPNIPVSVVEKVEIIRGPGSALYGSNAFLGVVNIITRKEGAEAELGIGENSGIRASGHFATRLENGAKVYANVDAEKHSGRTYQVGDVQVKDPLTSVYAEAGFAGEQLSFGARFQRNRLDQFVNLGGASPNNQHSSENYYVSVGYDWLKSDSRSLVSKLLYSQHNIAASGKVADAVDGVFSNSFYVGPWWQTKTWEFTTDYVGDLSESLQIATGISLRQSEQTRAGVVTNYFDSVSGEAIPNDDFYLGGIQRIPATTSGADLLSTFDMIGVYGQLEWTLSDKLTAFIGARYDRVKDIDNKFSPRLALIYDVAERHTLKVQYGESFRTPVTNELYSSDDVTSGNPNLTSEFVKTSELVYQYSREQFRLEAVLFHNDLKDFINKVPTPGGPSQFTFANTISKKISGVELEARFQPNEQLEFGGTATHLLDDPINASYKTYGSLFANLRVKEWLFNINTVLRSDLKVMEEGQQAFEHGAYALLNGSVNWQVTNSLRLALAMTNIADKRFDVYEPRLSDPRIQGMRRQTWLNMTYQF